MNRESRVGAGWCAVAAAACLAGTLGFGVVRAAGASQEKLSPLVAAIDVAPGETANRIVLGSRAPLSVAILGSKDFHPESIDPATVDLAGAPVLRTTDGHWDARLEDVNGDDRIDLVLRVAGPLVGLDAQTRNVALWGSTFAGRMVTGSASVLPVDRLVAVDSSQEKRPAITAEIEILDRTPSDARGEKIRDEVAVAILGSAELDASSIDPATVSLAGAPVLETGSGDLSASVEDANGDGRPDLLVHVSRALLRLSADDREATLGGQLVSGRMVLGTVAMKEAVRPGGSFASEPDGDHPFYGTNPAAITINDGATATPYPSQILVSGLTGLVRKVRVTLTGFSHAFPDDVDVMLVSPSGKAVTIMSDVGGSTAVAGLNLTFSDSGPSPLPDAGPLVSGTYTPTNIGEGDPFAGAPTPLPSSALSQFSKTPNGVWSLYIVDDVVGGVGSVSGGWSLEIDTDSGFVNSSAITINDAAPASPYPSTITVGGAGGSIARMTVTLILTHTFPDDVDVLLVGPDGRSVVLMSDVGGGSDVTDLPISFSDEAPGGIPDSGPITDTSYRPTNSGSGDGFAAPGPAPWAGSALSIFNGADPNGTWRLYVVDDATGDTGSLSAWGLFFEYDKNSRMAIPTGAPDVTVGPAMLYPSTVTIAGRSGVVHDVRVHIRGLTHTFPDDLDVLLVGPQGQNIVLMSDVGGAAPVTGVDLTFDDVGDVLPDDGPLAGGIYKPTNIIAGDPFSAPAPAPSAATSLGDTFEGTNPNGVWRLYVTDDAGGGFGSWEGWSLEILTLSTVSGGPVSVPSSGTSSPYPSTVVLSGIQGPADDIVVGLRITHPSPDDLDILLAGPGGQSAVLMSDVGGSHALAGTELILGDGFPAMPDAGPLVDLGEYAPTNVGAGDAFPPPAPTPGPAALSVFKGTDPNGTWSLFTVDDQAGNSGTIQRWDVFALNKGPAFLPEEVANLRWNGKNALRWDSAPNAARYRLYRGDGVDLPKLLTTHIDSCLRATTDFLTFTTGPILSETPAAGPANMIWYLVRGENDTAGEGSAGSMRISGAAVARIQDSSGPCTSIGTGACRQSSGTCTVTSPSACNTLSGCYGGQNTSCFDSDGDRIPDTFEIGGCVARGPCFFGTSPGNADTDGDAIKDGDEVYGTTGGLDLPAMGVDPCRKDILVETDWVQAPAVDPNRNKLALGQVTRIEAAFDAAPVSNPNGVTGIKLHIDYGQPPYLGGNSVVDPSGNNSVDPGEDCELCAEFNTIKVANFESNRNGYFHYVLMSDLYRNTGSSGLAELPGDDMIVSMGQYQTGDNDPIGHTFMHELGHNLGLRHGGFEDLNFKPNYNSLMNYTFAFCGVDRNFDGLPDGIADYSRGLYIPLDESNLDETKGLTGFGPAIDWNANGNATNTGITRNINCDVNRVGGGFCPGTYLRQPASCGVLGQCDDTACGLFVDQNDWSALDYAGLTDADFAIPNKQIITCQPFGPPKP